MPPRERNIDLGNLKKYPEFHALKMEVQDFVDAMNSLDDLTSDRGSGLTIAEKVAGRIWAKEKMEDFLSKLGLYEKKKKSRDKTFE